MRQPWYRDLSFDPHHPGWAPVSSPRKTRAHLPVLHLTPRKQALIQDLILSWQLQQLLSGSLFSLPSTLHLGDLRPVQANAVIF